MATGHGSVVTISASIVVGAGGGDHGGVENDETGLLERERVEADDREAVLQAAGTAFGRRHVRRQASARPAARPARRRGGSCTRPSAPRVTVSGLSPVRAACDAVHLLPGDALDGRAVGGGQGDRHRAARDRVAVDRDFDRHVLGLDRRDEHGHHDRERRPEGQSASHGTSNSSCLAPPCFSRRDRSSRYAGSSRLRLRFGAIVRSVPLRDSRVIARHISVTICKEHATIAMWFYSPVGLRDPAVAAAKTPVRRRSHRWNRPFRGPAATLTEHHAPPLRRSGAGPGRSGGRKFADSRPMWVKSPTSAAVVARRSDELQCRDRKRRGGAAAADGNDG